jgi:hypothetical protein
MPAWHTLLAKEKGEKEIGGARREEMLGNP